ncbi:MAG: DUF3006 domain-containing protein [Clostridiales bacterium]|nr:DUF3006 domain-containing protein [Clostridiales bacterium]
MEWIIDRIEENTAVIEYSKGKTFSAPLSALPNGAKEGDVITLNIDSNATEKRKENIKGLMNTLFRD